MSKKNSNGTTRNQTHDLQACSTVPQPSAPLRAPIPAYRLMLICRLTDGCWINATYREINGEKGQESTLLTQP